MKVMKDTYKGQQVYICTGCSTVVENLNPTKYFPEGYHYAPDGSQLAFVTDRTGKWEIWIMNADGSNQRPMFPNGALDGLTLNYFGVDERMLSWR